MRGKRRVDHRHAVSAKPAHNLLIVEARHPKIIVPDGQVKNNCGGVISTFLQGLQGSRFKRLGYEQLNVVSRPQLEIAIKESAIYRYMRENLSDFWLAVLVTRALVGQAAILERIAWRTRDIIGLASDPITLPRRRREYE